MKLIPVIKLVRPHQWVKNLFVFLPMFFNGAMFDYWCWQQATIAFFAFSFISSAIYCLNDIRDIDADRKHPTKKTRPLASGKISITFAYIIFAVLIICSLFTCCLSGIYTGKIISVVLLYLIANVAYCLKLKQYAIIDVFIISFGFVLRLIAGGYSCNIWLSPWIVSMTFLIALFLAFAKRRDDVVIRQETGKITRKNIVRYNLEFLNQTLSIIGAITIVCYIIYTVSPEVEARMNSQYVYITSIFVLAGILRYLQITIVDIQSGSPTKIMLHDRFIQICLFLWACLFAFIIYL